MPVLGSQGTSSSLHWSGAIESSRVSPLQHLVHGSASNHVTFHPETSAGIRSHLPQLRIQGTPFLSTWTPGGRRAPQGTSTFLAGKQVMLPNSTQLTAKNAGIYFTSRRTGSQTWLHISHLGSFWHCVPATPRGSWGTQALPLLIFPSDPRVPAGAETRALAPGCQSHQCGEPSGSW